MTLEDTIIKRRRHVMHRVAAGIPVSQVCRENGISRATYYEWRRRYLEFGDAGLWPKPVRPVRWNRQTPPALEHKVLAYALQCPTRGPQHISDQLALPAYGGVRISGTAVYKILKRHGLQTRWERLARLEGAALESIGLVTERSAKTLAKLRHVEASRPGELVCLDSFYIGRLKGVGRVWQLTACDAASSFGVAMVIVGEPRSAATVQFVEERVLPRFRKAGKPVQALLTDGGPEWRGPFTAWCKASDLEHRKIKPGHCWTNGFVERLQGTILQEHWRVAFRRSFFTSAAQLERALQHYLRFYNFERSHRGYRLKGRTPAQVFLSRV